jgi:thiamine biosynthesis lipoprotein
MSLQPHTFRQIHMAMPVEITVWTQSPEQAQTAAKAAFAKVALVDRLMNDYVAGSEISRLSDAAGKGPVQVSPELIRVLEEARRMHQLTGGAFDPTAGPVIAFWREATRTGQLPDPEALAAARARVGMDKVKIDAAAGTVELTTPGMRLDFGGIAKGYACDLATEELRRHGIDVTYVQAGGDMVLGDAPPGSEGWEIDVPGEEAMTLSNTAASISGDTARFVIIDGIRYSHVVDPRTGMGITSRQMAVVTGPSGIETDPLSTAGCVMEPEAFRAMIEKLEGFEARVFTAPEE